MSESDRDHKVEAKSTPALRKHSSEALRRQWAEDPRWRSVVRPYSVEEVLRYRGSLLIDYTSARHCENACGNFCIRKDTFTR